MENSLDTMFTDQNYSNANPPNITIKLTEDLKPGDVIINSTCCGTTIDTKLFLSVVLTINPHLEYRGSIVITVLEEGEIHEIETQLGEEFECIQTS